MSHRQHLVYTEGKYRWVDTEEYQAVHDAVFTKDQNRNWTSHKQAISEGHPWISKGMAVHPRQVEKFNSEARKAGVTGVHYRPDGCLVATSRSQRRAEMRRRGFIDRDAGYSDHG